MSENDQVKSMENLIFGKQQQKNDGKPCQACVDFKTWKRKMTSGNGARLCHCRIWIREIQLVFYFYDAFFPN